MIEEVFLKFDGDEFSPIVMYTINQSGVATEPNLVKGVHDSDAFLVFQCYNFHEVCTGVDCN
jgi:hypothetical protein